MALGEAVGPFAVGVDAGEPHAVVVIDGDLPMAVLAAAVMGEERGSAHRFGLLFFRFFFSCHGNLQTRAILTAAGAGSKYLFSKQSKQLANS